MPGTPATNSALRGGTKDIMKAEIIEIDAGVQRERRNVKTELKILPLRVTEEMRGVLSALACIHVVALSSADDTCFACPKVGLGISDWDRLSS